MRGMRHPARSSLPAPGSNNPATTTPEEQIEGAYQTLVGTLRADLLDWIAKNSPAFFEQLIVDLLVAVGYGGS
jgi:restriction system protein